MASDYATMTDEELLKIYSECLLDGRFKDIRTAIILSGLKHRTREFNLAVVQECDRQGLI